MESLKAEVEKMNEQADQGNFEAFVQWAKDRDMSEGDLVEVIFKGVAVVSNSQLEDKGPGDRFGAVIQGPKFGMRVEVERMDNEAFGELVREASNAKGEDH